MELYISSQFFVILQAHFFMPGHLKVVFYLMNKFFFL